MDKWGYNYLIDCFDNCYVGKQPVAWKEYCTEYCLKELQESMDRCTSHWDMTEILLKMALNTIQSIQSFYWKRIQWLEKNPVRRHNVSYKPAFLMNIQSLE